MVRAFQIGIAGAGLLASWTGFAASGLSPLIVRRQAGLERVVAWYPTGDMRTLAFEPEEDAFLGLPPVRFVEQPTGRIEVFKHFSDGSVIATHAWALVDGPELLGFVLCDPAEQLIFVELDSWGGAIERVWVDNADGEQLAMHRVRNAWHLDAVELNERFVLELDWHDGRQGRWPAVWRADQLSVRAPLGGRRLAATRALQPVSSLDLGERQVTFAGVELAMASTQITSTLEVAPGHLLVGSAGGDLVALWLEGSRVERVERLDGGRWQQPVVGMVQSVDGVVLLGLLGDGLWELEGGRLRRAAMHLGTRMITAVVEEGGSIFIGTAYHGLWRATGSRLERTAYPASHVFAIRSGERLQIEGGAGRYALGRDGRWQLVDRGVHSAASEPELTAAVDFAGVALVGSREHGVFAWRGQALEAVDLDLTPSERQIRAIAVWQDELWLATRAGLLVVSRDSCGVTVSRRHQAQVFSLALDATGLTAISAAGRYLIDAEAELHWLDRQAATPNFAARPLTAASGT